MFECEIRYFIKNIDEFKSKLEKLGGNIINTYKSTDYYYRPKKGDWNPLTTTLRIRVKEGTTPTILFQKVEIIECEGIIFKKSVYPQGKIPLFSGELTLCRSILEDLGFEPWITIKKRIGESWHIPKYNTGTGIEYIEGLGWVGEFEVKGEDIKEIKEKMERNLKLLGISEYTYKPISLVYAEMHKLL